MSRFKSWLSLPLVGLAFLMLDTGAVQAQATRTWVSGVGDDVNPCSRTAPCKTFAGAISKTAAGGIINCLDPGGFGAVTINKSLTIDCTATFAGVLASGSFGINVVTAVSDTVRLRGLSIEGNTTGTAGIQFIGQGGVLHVEKSIIKGFGSGSGSGIKFAPTTGASQLFVEDTSIADNLKSGSAAAILIQPTGTGFASGILDGVKMSNSGNGLFVDGSLTTGSSMNIVVRNSFASGNSVAGINVNSAAGHPTIKVLAERIAATTNGTGILSTGVGADVDLAFSIVSGNNTGISFSASGEIRSYQGSSGFGTNQLRGNISVNGTPSSTLPLE